MNSDPADPAALKGRTVPSVAAAISTARAQGKSGNVATEPVAPLWTVSQVGAYLQRGQRTIWKMLRIPGAEPGSIPHIRLPGRAVRFIPDQIVAWVEDGCPPAVTFARWHRKKK